VAVLAGVPLVFGFGGNYTNIAQFVTIYVILALGLNVVVGYTGLLDLGYVSFIAVGAVVAAFCLSLTVTPTTHTLEGLDADRAWVIEIQSSKPGVATAENAYPDRVRSPIKRTTLPAGQAGAAGDFAVVRGATAGDVAVTLRPAIMDGEERYVVAFNTSPSADGDELFGDDVPLPDRLTSPVGGTDNIPGSHPLVFGGSYLLILLLAGLICAGIGALRGIPTLRLTGDYYAIVTLGIAEIIFLFLFNEEWLSGGAFGIKLDVHSTPHFFGADSLLYWDNWQFYALLTSVLACTITAMYCLQFSRLGRAWAAIRLDPTAAQASGVNITWAKMIAFAVSGFIGGVGGALYAVWAGTVAVRSLEVWQSILVLCCCVLGGMGSIRGVIAGGAILMTIGELLRYDLPLVGRITPEARFLFYGVLIIMLMRFRPQGILPLAPRKVAVTHADLEAVRAASNPLFTLAEPKGEA
jgi:branched-chain amino acid transport system permease protein